MKFENSTWPAVKEQQRDSIFGFALFVDKMDPNIQSISATYNPITSDGAYVAPSSTVVNWENLCPAPIIELRSTW